MGCGCSKSSASEPDTRNDAAIAQRLQQEESRQANASASTSSQRSTAQNRQGWNTAGTGHKLGGGDTEDPGATPEEKRQKALEAAEKRQATIPGVSAEKAAQMRRQQQKEEYLAKLSEHYHKQKMDLPMGLNAASVEQLKQHWEQVRKGDTGAEQVLSMQ